MASPEAQARYAAAKAGEKLEPVTRPKPLTNAPDVEIAGLQGLASYVRDYRDLLRGLSMALARQGRTLAADYADRIADELHDSWLPNIEKEEADQRAILDATDEYGGRSMEQEQRMAHRGRSI